MKKEKLPFKDEEEFIGKMREGKKEKQHIG